MGRCGMPATVRVLPDLFVSVTEVHPACAPIGTL
jgi:hypothetical protein